MSEHLELKEWNKSKEELIIQLTESANLLDKRHHYLCYSRIAGNTVSSIGSGMLIAGLALAPVSAGASLPALAVAGGMIGFVGNSTSMTSVVYENIAERLDMRETKELMDSFHHNTEAMLSREASVYWNFVNMISPGLSAYNAVNAFVKFSQLFGTITDTAETGGALFTKALCTSGTMGRVFGKFALHASLALNAVGIVIDTVDSGLASRDIYRTKNSRVRDEEKPSKMLRQFITKFRTLDFDEIESRFVKFNAAISVVNRGRFKARFSVKYLIDESEIIAVATETFKRKQALLKEFNVPKVGSFVVLKIEVLMVNCDLLWKAVFKEEIRPPYFRVFELSGSQIMPHIKEIKYQGPRT